MPEVTEQSISCPYCGETISVLIEDSLPEQQYIEDCQVCCRPIVIDVAVGADGAPTVGARVENE
jgi:hypothetical protein